MASCSAGLGGKGGLRAVWGSLSTQEAQLKGHLVEHQTSSAGSRSVLAALASAAKRVNGRYERFLERTFPRFYVLYVTFTKGMQALFLEVKEIRKIKSKMSHQRLSVQQLPYREMERLRQVQRGSVPQCPALPPPGHWDVSSPEKGHRGTVTSLLLLATLVLTQARMPLAFLATQAHCWLLFSCLSVRTPRPFSPRQLQPPLPEPVAMRGVVVAQVQALALALAEAHPLHVGHQPHLSESIHMWGFGSESEWPIPLGEAPSLPKNGLEAAAWAGNFEGTWRAWRQTLIVSSCFGGSFAGTCSRPFPSESSPSRPSPTSWSSS
uniref:Uncharacterized protein n=1 Tax=Athene cunicularia TaxID=194338 RepID=A0A663N628_ATHCN